jgi:hypothetical protein
MEEQERVLPHIGEIFFFFYRDVFNDSEFYSPREW